MTSISDFTLNVKIISLQFEKPYVSIHEEDAVRLEEMGVNVKRVVSERFGPSQQIALKMAPEFKQMEGFIPRESLQVGGWYEVHISPYRYMFNNKTGISLQANFMKVIPRF